MTSINERFVKFKHTAHTKAEITIFRAEVAKELRSVKSAKEDIYARYKGVHGRFQQSQLDVLDIREYKLCSIIDALSCMFAAVA